MEFTTFATGAEFERAVGPWLVRDRANNLILSALSSAVRSGDGARGWLTAEQGEPQLALFHIPPRYLLLSAGSAEAVAWAVGRLDAEIPGVVGPGTLADAFAHRWAERADRLAYLNAEMTHYTLDRLEPFTRPDGLLRKATVAEFERLAPMAAAAARDMNLPAPEQRPTETEKGLRRALADGSQFVWANGSFICAMASYVTALPHSGARIRGVYTPPEFRGRGFGAAVTGALAEWLLEEGQDWVALFADNANAVATRIYRRLGFVPGSVFRSYRFE